MSFFDDPPLHDFPDRAFRLLLSQPARQDPSMPLRTLLYAVLFWEREWRAWEELTPVVPIIFHTGGRLWDTHRTLADLIDAPDALRTYLPSWQPLFWDLSLFKALPLPSEDCRCPNSARTRS